ncbi:MAG: acryloyl-CoA reductase [Myxococcales bacterium FL481]|nr:MAG: acryloyl-CoA reductase [Myxococcales bacterium FL481]
MNRDLIPTEFKALRIHPIRERTPGQVVGVEARLESVPFDELAEEEVVIRGRYSTINYKDALAATGAGKILRRLPLIGGIDVAGTVARSNDARFRVGDEVVVTGCGLGETHHGGYAEFVGVPGDWVVPLPASTSSRWAMSLGTAGFTAALAIHRLEHNGLRPGTGPVAVTGATGGVGSLAIDMLAGRGYEVVAITGKREADVYLKSLGASAVWHRDEMEMGQRPLESALWAAAIDNLGGDMLAWLTRSMKFWGGIASVGLTRSAELHTTVMPFILRGVNLLGINSMATPRPLRLSIWERLAAELRPRHLDKIVTREVSLEDLTAVFAEYVGNRVRGRVLVDLDVPGMPRG